MQGWAQWNVHYAEKRSTVRRDAVFCVERDQRSRNPPRYDLHRRPGGGADPQPCRPFQIAFDPQHFANVAFSDDHLINTEVSGSETASTTRPAAGGPRKLHPPARSNSRLRRHDGLLRRLPHHRRQEQRRPLVAAKSLPKCLPHRQLRVTSQ